MPFETVFKDFAGRDDAIEWIINNQFGRRNLSDYQRGVLALRMKPIMEERARAQQGERTDIRQKSDEGIKPIRTDEAVSELANVSRDTIRKIERIEEVAQPEVKALASAGEVSINLASQFTELPQEVQQEAIAAIAEQNVTVSPKSDERTPDIFTGEVQPVAPVKAPAPIRTDTAVAAEADELLDGIRAAVEVQRLAKQKANAVNQYSEPSDNLLSEPKDEHETKAATKAAELFNTNRRSKGSTVNPHRQAAQPVRQELHTPSR